MAATETVGDGKRRNGRAMQARAGTLERCFGDEDVEVFLLLFVCISLLDAVLEVLFRV